MAYKPGDFFLGIIDFFGILVPGAVLLFLHGERLAGNLGLRLDHDPTAIWAAFFVGSYVLGSFLLGFGFVLNRLLWLYLPETKDNYYNEVKSAIKLPQGVRENRVDAFYRAYSFVRISNSPSALAEIERQMADYKLFRGLAVVFLFDVLLVCFRHSGPIAARLAFSSTLFILAGWRFLFQLGWTYRITFETYALLRGIGATPQDDPTGK
jgi:hypothetical protein